MKILNRFLKFSPFVNEYKKSIIERLTFHGLSLYANKKCVNVYVNPCENKRLF